MDDTTNNYYGQICETGLDWVTGFGARGASSLSLETLASAMMDEERDAGRTPSPASRLGFEGWKGDHWFFGRRSDGNLMVASSVCAAYAGEELIKVATNVSRLDLMYTVHTPGNTTHFVDRHFDEIERARRAGRGSGQFSKTICRPSGETLFLNSRSSNRYGRFYDKGAESGFAPPLELWRYEVELKKEATLPVVEAIRAGSSAAVLAFPVVSRFFHEKQVVSINVVVAPVETQLPRIPPVSRDKSRWLRTCVRLSLASEICRRGLEPVLDDIGLSYLVPKAKGE